MHDADDTRHAIPDDTTRHDAVTVTPARIVPGAPPDASPAILQVDAARRAGVSVRTIQRAIDRGDLQATRDGLHCWIQVDELDRWQIQRKTRSATARVVARDNDVSHVMPDDATVGASFDAPRDVSGHDMPSRPRLDPEVDRLQGEIADLKVERDRWHQAFERESVLREEETRQLRQLIQQEQALSFSRFAAIEATTRPDTTMTNMPPGRSTANHHAEADTQHNARETEEVPRPSADALALRWRRWWRQITGEQR